MTLKMGPNGWSTTQDITLERKKDMNKPVTTDEYGTKSVAEDWWAGEGRMPDDAVSADFVVNFHQHWDNNGQKNYRCVWYRHC